MVVKHPRCNTGPSASQNQIVCFMKPDDPFLQGPKVTTNCYKEPWSPSKNITLWQRHSNSFSNKAANHHYQHFNHNNLQKSFSCINITSYWVKKCGHSCAFCECGEFDDIKVGKFSSWGYELIKMCLFYCFPRYIVSRRCIY